MKSVTSVVLCMFALSGGLAFGKTHKKNTSKRVAPVPATSSRRASTVKSSAKSKVVARKATSSSKRGKSAVTASASKSKSKSAQQARPVAVRRPTQQTPSPERYREIQQALADKGYYKGEVNGSWGADSASALQRFQKERNLTETGKLDSLSLIGLGLGPKRNLSAHSPSEARPKDDNRRTEGSERP